MGEGRTINSRVSTPNKFSFADKTTKSNLSKDVRLPFGWKIGWIFQMRAFSIVVVVAVVVVVDPPSPKMTVLCSSGKSEDFFFISLICEEERKRSFDSEKKREIPVFFSAFRTQN